MMTEEEVRLYHRHTLTTVREARRAYADATLEGAPIEAILDAYALLKVAVGEMMAVCHILQEDPPSDCII